MTKLTSFCESLAWGLEQAEHEEQFLWVLLADDETRELLQDMQKALAAYNASLDPEHDWRRGHESQ